MAMTLRGHVVLDPGRNGRRLVWQIGLTIRFLNERLAHQILRSSGNAAIGSYSWSFEHSVPGDRDDVFSSLVVLNPIRERPRSETLSALPQKPPQEFTSGRRHESRKPPRNATAGAPAGFIWRRF